MNPEDLLKTVYLGDRSLKRIIIDGWSNQVIMQINLISRIPQNEKYWNYYADQDIEDGMIVFNKVESIIFDPPGYIPNDAIEITSVDTTSNNTPNFTITTTSVYTAGNDLVNKTVIITIVASEVHLEDPKNPGVAIN